MSIFLSFTVLGIVTGAIYGILATGLVVTYNTTGVFNFAQGAVGMVAAFSYWQLWQDWHWPFLLAIVFIVFVEAPLLAIVVEFVLFRRIHGASVERSLMVSLGLLVILLGVATIFWSSPDVMRSVPAYFTSADGTVASVRLFGANGVTIQDQQIIDRRGGGRGRPCSSASSCAASASAWRCAPSSTTPSWWRMSGAKPYRHVTDRVGPGLHAGRGRRSADRPARGPDGPDLDPAHPVGPQRLRRRRGGPVAQPAHDLRRRPRPRPRHAVLRRLPARAHQPRTGLGADRGGPGAVPLRRAARDSRSRGSPRPAAWPSGRHPGSSPPGSPPPVRSSSSPAWSSSSAMVGATALSTLSQGMALGIVGLSLVLLVGYRRAGLAVPADVHGHRRLHHGQGVRG